MKKLASKVIMLFVTIMLSCSIKDQTIVPEILNNSGTLKVSFEMNRVGFLRKIKAIEMEKLYVVLSADGQDIVFDTIQLNGGSHERTVEKIYDNLVSRVGGIVEWTLSVESRDQNDQLVYSGDTTFIIAPPKDTVEITLSLNALQSMLIANYYPIRDSVTRCVLRIDDGATEIDTTFAKQSLLGDTVQLTYDYLSASTYGESHDISLDVYGVFLGVDMLLYTGDTMITVFSGEDVNYEIILRYVGPGERHGAAEMIVTLGKIGTVTVNGILEPELTEEGLVLWNKLGSESEIFNSEYGPDLAYYSGGSGIHIPANREFISGMFGNAITIAPGSYSNMSRVHNLILNNLSSYINPEKGTIECYVYINSLPVEYDHGVYRIFGGAYGLSSGISLQIWPSTITFGLHFGVSGNPEVEWSEIDDLIGVWTHIAAVWDRNGINSTYESMQLYINGEKKAYEEEANWGVDIGNQVDIAGGNDQNIARQFYLDNLKMYNYAKTDFSDRFTE